MLTSALCKGQHYRIYRRLQFDAHRRRCSVKAVMAPKGSRGGPSPHYSSYVQVFHPANGTASASVLLFFDKERYLFNVGEGLQRLMREYKQRMGKITTILSTRVSPDTLGGLPGFLLSQVPPGQADALNQVLDLPGLQATVVGPRGLGGYAAAFKHYAGAARLEVVEAEGGAGCPAAVTSPVVTITPLALTPHPPTPTPPPAAAAAGTEPGTSVAAAAASTSKEDAGPAAKRQKTDSDTAAVPAAGNGAAGLPHPSGSTTSSSSSGGPVLAYLCQLAAIPGKFDPVKAAQLGVPKGPMFGALQRGEAVTSISGAAVLPAQVLAGGAPGAALALVDTPSLAHLAAAQVQPALEQLRQELLSQQQQQEGSINPSTAAAAGGGGKRVVLVHLGPQAVVGHPDYNTWMDSWGPGAHHILAPPTAPAGSMLLKSAALQAHLAALEPGVFSWEGFRALEEGYTQQAQHAGQQAAARSSSSEEAATAAGLLGPTALDKGCVVVAPHMLKVMLSPVKHQGYSWEGVPQQLELTALQDGLWRDRPVLTALHEQYKQQKAAALAAPPPQQQQLPAAEAGGFALTLLGTISACPTQLRNVSGYYLDCGEGRGGAMLDCGEDSYGQLLRRFGQSGADRALRTLQFVWVSHMHADHHGALYGLLLRRQALLEADAAAAAAAGAGRPAPDGQTDASPSGLSDQQHANGTAAAAAAGVTPLLVLGPLPLFKVLRAYEQVLPLSYTFAPSSSLYEGAAAAGRPLPPPVAAAVQAVVSRLGLSRLVPFPVDHVAHSSGLVVEGAAGWRLVMSGDTRPCQAVINAARGATLLVHEATFEDELAGDAIAKKHSTVSEALGVAAAAGAYRVVLTHFSGRYPKMQLLTNSNGGSGGEEGSRGDGQANGSAAAAGGGQPDLSRAIIGFDLMTLRSQDLGWLPLLRPLLDELCRDEEGVVTGAEDTGVDE